ncbi:MAG: nickel-dependent lactate racemase [Planctomycetota bacterium]|nr:nickel-dependent lactate racemase [Planctomycetota bacterium]
MKASDKAKPDAAKPVELRYHTGRLPLSVPASADVLCGPGSKPAPDALAAVRAALAKPIGSPPLAELLRRRGKPPASVAITISDITRPVPNEPVVTALLESLNAAGVPDSAVVVIIATGMHRPSTPEERRIMLGEALLRRVEVIDHVSDDTASHVPISENPPVSVNARFVRAAFKIVTGLIEPHFMAGYSGGRKGVCPGLVDLRTVQRFHGYKTMADPRSTEGVMAGNPCHEEAVRVAGLVGVDFLVNVTITHDRKLSGVYAGDMAAAHAQGCREVEHATGAVVDHDYDLVVTCGGGYPLDQSFYQTGKGMVTAMPALGPESTLLIVSACTEVGSPEFKGLLLKYENDWRRFLVDAKADPNVIKDQWQYQMMSRVLERVGLERILLVNDGLDRDLQRKLSVTPLTGEGDVATRTQRFIDEFAASRPGARIAVIPEGPYTMLRRG